MIISTNEYHVMYHPARRVDCAKSDCNNMFEVAYGCELDDVYGAVCVECFETEQGDLVCDMPYCSYTAWHAIRDIDDTEFDVCDDHIGNIGIDACTLESHDGHDLETDVCDNADNWRYEVKQAIRESLLAARIRHIEWQASVGEMSYTNAVLNIQAERGLWPAPTRAELEAQCPE